MTLEEALQQVEDLNLKKVEKIDPSKMTLEELSRLRFTWLSEEESKAVREELRKRGIINT